VDDVHRMARVGDSGVEGVEEAEAVGEFAQ
jgi:hypothetical protein